MTRGHAGDGRPPAEYAIERRVSVPIERSQSGIDPVSMVRAALTNVAGLHARKAEGSRAQRLNSTRRPR
jgi:hypothetical protein